MVFVLLHSVLASGPFANSANKALSRNPSQEASPNRIMAFSVVRWLHRPTASLLRLRRNGTCLRLLTNLVRVSEILFLVACNLPKFLPQSRKEHKEASLPTFFLNDRYLNKLLRHRC